MADDRSPRTKGWTEGAVSLFQVVGRFVVGQSSRSFGKSITHEKGDEEQKHLITREMVRKNTLATWKRFDPSVRSSGLAIRRFVRTEEYVEIELFFTELIPLEGRELLAHGILIQRVKEQAGRAMLISQRLVEHRSKWISLAEENDAREAGATVRGMDDHPSPPR